MTKAVPVGDINRSKELYIKDTELQSIYTRAKKIGRSFGNCAQEKES